MANLINAFAHPRPAAHAPELQARPEAGPNGGVEKPAAAESNLTAAPSGPYDIADALADVARAIAPKAAIAPKEAAPRSEAAVTANAVSVLKAAATPRSVITPKAAVSLKTALVPKRAFVATAIRAPKAATGPTVEVKNDWQPIASAPLDRNVQVGVTFKDRTLAIFFPCRLTEAGWINAVVKAPLLHEPACWREWREDYLEGA